MHLTQIQVSMIVQVTKYYEEPSYITIKVNGTQHSYQDYFSLKIKLKTM